METIIHLQDVQNISSNTLTKLQAILGELPIPLKPLVKFDNEINWFWKNAYQLTISTSDYLSLPENTQVDYKFTINANNETEALDYAVNLLEKNPNSKYIFLDEIVRLPELDQQSKDDISFLLNTDENNTTLYAGYASRVLEENQIQIRDITDIVKMLK